MNRLLALALCVPFALSTLAGAQEKKPTPVPGTAPAPAPAPTTTAQAKKDEAKKDEKKAEQTKKGEGKKDEPKKEEKKGAAPEMPADEPGDMHKWLANFEGEWQASAIEYGEDGKPGNPEKGTMK